MSDTDRQGSAVAFGSLLEFQTSEDPHCKDGAKACIDCLCIGQCLMTLGDAVADELGRSDAAGPGKDPA